MILSERARELQRETCWDSPAPADSPDDHLERLLRSLDDRRPEPSRCDGFTRCGDWPW